MKYRQVVWKLRLQEPGKPDRISERPAILDADGLPARYLDDDSPTFLTAKEIERYGIDAAFAVKTGALVEVDEPKPKPTRKRGK